MNGNGSGRRLRGIPATLSLVVLNTAVACASVGLAVPAPALASGASGDPPAASVRPELRWGLDAPLLGAGASLLVAGQLLDAATRPVPAAGLDPADVHWSFDRGVIGERSTQADNESNYVRDAALVYPLAVAFISQPPGTRLRGTLRRSAMYGEALLIAEGISLVLKSPIDRPRPYTYLPADRRPDDSAYDVTVGEAFRSMPSGHATVSFCAAGFAMTDHLISRPDAGWLERAGVPFAGGVLAGMTATLRVEAGQHFPSDVIAGGLIGTSCGVAVPLAHRYLDPDGRRAPLPSGAAWRQGIIGLIGGIGTGVLIANALH